VLILTAHIILATTSNAWLLLHHMNT